MLDTQDHAPTDTPLNDLGPLAWVFEELRKSLEGANKAIRRFIRESEQARHSDLEAVDPGALRVARQQLHLLLERRHRRRTLPRRNICPSCV